MQEVQDFAIHERRKGGGREKEGRETYFAQREGQNVFNLSHTINCLPLQSRVGKRFFIYCPDLYDFTS